MSRPILAAAMICAALDSLAPFNAAYAQTIGTVAGDGLGRFNGDEGPAIDASLNQPFAVAFDAAGNLFIADLLNHRIRRVDASTGLITTVAGDGGVGFAGDGGLATNTSLFSPSGVVLDAAGNVFIGDRNNHRIRRVDAVTGVITTVAGNGVPGYSGDGGPATHASLAWPFRTVSRLMRPAICTSPAPTQHDEFDFAPGEERL